MKLIETVNAVGTVLCQDITQIIKGVTKDARFRKGHIVTKEDIPVLLSLGKEHLYVWEQKEGLVHENDAAVRLCKICKNKYMNNSDVKEGKIQLFSEIEGLFTVDSKRLFDLNSLQDIMIATRHGNTVVKKGDSIAGFRIIPLVTDEKNLIEAESIGNNKPLLAIYPWQRKKAAIITTGNEIYKGRIKDTFTPVIEQKLAAFQVKVIYHEVCYDDTDVIKTAVLNAQKAGAEIILCTGGMSVDPDDLTPGAIQKAGAKIISYGAPVLPGAMFLLGYLPSEQNSNSEEDKNNKSLLPSSVIPVMGLPGCVMFAKRTVFDLILPRIIANQRINKQDIIAYGEGGLCLNCEKCTYPNCGFGK